jgi:hypothetical protein
MFKKILLALAGFALTFGVCIACAQTTAQGSIIPFDVPAWLQNIIGVGGNLSLVALPFISQKIVKLLTLVQNLKNVFTELIGFFAVLKGHLKDPLIVKEYNDVCSAVSKTLKDTGNNSLIQKANMFDRFKLPETPIEEAATA